MELDVKTEWPEHCPKSMGNPFEIEKFLRSEIVLRNVTLIGELDLVTETSHAGAGWSLFQLADYLVNKDIIKSSLTVEIMADWKYPATLAIWSVGKAQLAEDGNKLWDLVGYSQNQRASLATMFSHSIELLGLATFSDELLGAQRHVQLARIHAMIPDFATNRYSEIIHRAVKFNQPKVQILNYIVDDSIISKGVRRLFSARQEIGLDLIERSFNFLAYGYELDLPERLRSKLSRNSVIKKVKNKSQNFPSILFVEYAGAIEIRGDNSWQVKDELGQDLDPHNIPSKDVFVEKDGVDKIKILDTSAGYLLFDINGTLIYGNTLPLDGGYLLWRKDVKIETSFDHLDDGYLPAWPDWSFTFFYDLPELVLSLPNSNQRKFERLRSVSVIDYEVQNLKDVSGNSVYSSYPVLEEIGFVKLTDHLTDTQIELENHTGPVVDEPGGEIDMTISSGLGKSKSFKGLVIPGIEILGLENALTVGSKSAIEIKLPIDWHFTYPIEFDGLNNAKLEFKIESDQEMVLLKVLDYASEEHFLGLKLPVLYWSVEFSDRESVTVDSTLRLDIASRKRVRAIILHGVNEYVPIVMAGEVPIPSRRRGTNARYDLRLLADVLGEDESSVSMKWNYEELELVRFVKPVSKKMQTVDLNDLAAAAIARNMFSEQEWNSYQADTQQKSKNIRDLLRRQRGN